MNYETISSLIKSTGTVHVLNATEVIEKLLSSYEEEQLESWNHLYGLLDLIQNAKKFNGGADAFHNLAVSLARNGLYDKACDLIEIGLRYTSESVDLLADYLVYGIKCDKLENAKMHFDKLGTIPKSKWNWRAFDFSIDYLLAISMNEENAEQKAQIEKNLDLLCAGFQEHHPDDENAYFAEYTINESRGQINSSIERLEKIINTRDNLKAPRCAMKLAEHYFERANYETAMKYIDKSKSFVVAFQPAIEVGSLYMLSALCGMAALYKEGINLDHDISQRVHQIYKDCEAAEAAHRRKRLPHFGNLEVQRDVLEKLSGIPYFGQ
jgi:tetratricopeptide (TPR) repeat protein